MPFSGKLQTETMGGATVGQWGQLAPTEMRLWTVECGGKTMLLPPLKFGEHAVNHINREFCPNWRKAVAPPLTETKPVLMKWEPQKPNIKPILFCIKIPIFNQILRSSYSKIPIKYQENTKKVGTELPNTDLVLVFSWYAKFLVTD